jgi:GrpB-like predicted nucleotidyltransferase (UPF0157 family)
MKEEESLNAAIHEPVELSRHDPAWSRMFLAEKQRLLSALPGMFLDLQHIGSTAVAGLVAKPVIDLLAGVASMEVARALGEPLGRLGYTTSLRFNASLPDRQWFMRWANGRRTHHLHVVVHADVAWRERIAFRDALRADPELARRYEALKRALANTHRDDREAYTSAKSTFISTTLAAGGFTPDPPGRGLFRR